MGRISAGLLLSVAVASAAPAPSWHKKLAPALAEAGRTGKPVLVYVFDNY